jgi:hypothetical protein
MHKDVVKPFFHELFIIFMFNSTPRALSRGLFFHPWFHYFLGRSFRFFFARLAADLAARRLEVGAVRPGSTEMRVLRA